MGLEITLDTLGRGALEEKFQDALAEVVKNTCDPNTDAVAKRKLTIELTFTPDKIDRNRCELTTKVTAKLGATKPLISTVHMGIDTDSGEIAAVEHAPVQGELFPKPKAKEQSSDKVVPIRDRAVN